MADKCEIHGSHSHQHGPGCGHTSVQHDGHTDYLHDGHLHNVHEGHVDEHRLSVGGDNPASDARHECKAHETDHKHGAGCGHEAVPHGDHTDYLVNGHLHHQKEGRCQSHGEVKIAA